jgi:hypothetical protein
MRQAGRLAIGHQSEAEFGNARSGRSALQGEWRSALGVAAQRRDSLKSMKLQILSDLHLEMVKPHLALGAVEELAVRRHMDVQGRRLLLVLVGIDELQLV